MRYILVISFVCLVFGNVICNDQTPSLRPTAAQVNVPPMDLQKLHEQISPSSRQTSPAPSDEMLSDSSSEEELDPLEVSVIAATPLVKSPKGMRRFSSERGSLTDVAEWCSLHHHRRRAGCPTTPPTPKKNRENRVGYRLDTPERSDSCPVTPLTPPKK